MENYNNLVDKQNNREPITLEKKETQELHSFGSINELVYFLTFELKKNLSGYKDYFDAWLSQAVENKYWKLDDRDSKDLIETFMRIKPIKCDNEWNVRFVLWDSIYKLTLADKYSTLKMPDWKEINLAEIIQDQGKEKFLSQLHNLIRSEKQIDKEEVAHNKYRVNTFLLNENWLNIETDALFYSVAWALDSMLWAANSDNFMKYQKVWYDLFFRAIDQSKIITNNGFREIQKYCENIESNLWEFRSLSIEQREKEFKKYTCAQILLMNIRKMGQAVALAERAQTPKDWFYEFSDHYDPSNSKNYLMFDKNYNNVLEASK